MGSIAYIPTRINLKSQFEQALAPLMRADVNSLLRLPYDEQAAVRQNTIGAVLDKMTSAGHNRDFVKMIVETDLKRAFHVADKSFEARHPREAILRRWHNDLMACAAQASQYAARPLSAQTLYSKSY